MYNNSFLSQSLICPWISFQTSSHLSGEVSGDRGDRSGLDRASKDARVFDLCVWSENLIWYYNEKQLGCAGERDENAPTDLLSVTVALPR